MSYRNLRVLFYRAGTCNEQRVLENLKKIVKEVVVVMQECKNNDIDADLAKTLFLSVHMNKIDMIFSVDYYPIVAEVANTAGIAYVSWVLDSPHYTLYSTTSYYDSSYIFHFDREECQRLQAMGRTKVFHRPLATDPDYFQKQIDSSAKQKMTDISFLGSSYQNEHDYFDKSNGLSEYECGYFEGLMKAQSELYGVSVMGQALPEDLQQRLLKACKIRLPETYDLPMELVAVNILEKKLSVRERRDIVKRLSRTYGITLYSESEALKMEGVTFRGYADYETQMPCAFAYSRININPTLRSIHSGIPLRALDIMACGGFLLSNYQPELAEWFEDGKSVAMYGSMDELEEKAGYYLKHEDERKEVARRGYKVICDQFTYDKALISILEKVDGI